MSVFVSGATGFIAQHIVRKLLDENYKVIGSVRSQEKADRLSRQFNNPNLTLVIVKDIAEPGAFDEAFKTYGKEIKYVLHTASPFYFETKDVEKELLIPARNGTLGILESVKKYAADTVERFVITSSYAAIVNSSIAGDDSVTFTEQSWNPDTWEYAVEHTERGYRTSKKIAEEAAWKFMEENKDKVKFELTAVNPVFVFGPQLFDENVKSKLNTSCECINAVLHTPRDAEVPMFSAGFIDVRDVARAHLLAFQRDDLIGKRLLMFNGKWNSYDILHYLNEDFPVLKGKIPDPDPSKCIEITQPGAKVDNSWTKKTLGFKFISLRDTIHDTAAQILKHEGRL